VAIEFSEINVCVVCIHLLANGEFNDGTDAAEKCFAGQQRIWGSTHLIPGGGSEEDDGDRGFSWSACEGCGDTDGGDRFQAFAELDSK
jgi:hypothetical protein